MSPFGSGKSNNLHASSKRTEVPPPTLTEAMNNHPEAGPLDPTAFWEEYLFRAAQVNIRDEMIYATLITERMVSTENKKLLTRAQRREWENAVARFHKQRAKGVPACDLFAEAWHYEPFRTRPTDGQLRSMRAFSEEFEQAVAAGPEALEALKQKMIENGTLKFS